MTPACADAQECAFPFMPISSAEISIKASGGGSN
jgi:hypothetical protein